MFYPFQDENALKVNNIYCQKLVEESLSHTINENKTFFDPNCEKINNDFVRLSQVQNEIRDVDLSVDYDDYYLTGKDEEPPLSKGEGTSGCVNLSNVMISDNSMREMIRSLNSQ